MTIVPKIIFTFCGILIMLHIWGAVSPSHFNWGTQSFAFFEPIIGVTVLLFALILFVPAIRRFLIKIFEDFMNKLSKMPTPVIFLGIAVLFILLMLLLPTHALMLGDSKLILLTTSKIPSNTDASANYRNQPLTLLILRFTQNIFEQEGINSLENVYKYVDLAGGIIFFIVIFIFVRGLPISPFERLLSGLFLFAGGGIQLFFGYVENYALLYSFTSGYVVTGWLSLQKKIHPIIPIIFFAIIAGLHLGSLILLPTMIFLIYLRWRENRRGLFIMAGTAVVFFSMVFFLSNYNINQFIIRIKYALIYDFLPIFKALPDIPYTMFSWLHSVDWFNLNMLVIPFGLIPTAIIMIFHRTKLRTKNPELLFLVSTAIFGLLFTFIISPGIGMFRDWDLMSSFFVPLMFLTVYVFMNYLDSIERKNLFFFIVSLFVMHTIFRMGVDANEDKHLMRAEIQTNPLFLGSFAQILYYDRLANAFWERKDYSHSKYWYERYTVLDSTNPRIIANLSDVYRKLNDKENLFRMLKRSVDLGSQDPGVYANLGVEYFNRGNVAAAIEVTIKAFTINPQAPVAHANLGFFYMHLRDYKLAAQHLEIAVNVGMNSPLVFRNLADSYVALGDFGHATQRYIDYLRLEPSDTLIRNRVIRLNELITKSR